MITSSSTADGHNEAEFGMSWCAGFGEDFYNAYFQVLNDFFAANLIVALPSPHMQTDNILNKPPYEVILYTLRIRFVQQSYLFVGYKLADLKNLVGRFLW